MRVGARVHLRFDGQRIGGTIWSEGPDEGQLWVALDSGKWALVERGTAKMTDAHGIPSGELGQVA